MVEAVASYLLAGIMTVSSVILAIIGKKMAKGDINPNYLTGVRTQRALRSKENWYSIQSACAPYMLMLAVAYLDSAILFAVQGVFHEAIPILVPCVIVVAQSIIGIALTHRAASTADH